MDFSNNFKKVIQKAELYSDGIINHNHIFMGILSVEECRGYKILSMIIDVDDAKKKMKQMLGDFETVDVKDKKKRESKLTVEAENIMMQSQLEAKKFHSEVVRTEHLILALTRAKVIGVVSYSDVESIVVNMNRTLNETNNDLNMNDEANMNEPINQSNGVNKKSKTPLLDEFSTDLTKLARENKLDPTVGRKNELRRIAQVLSRRKKNNPVLIGDPGCVIEDTEIIIRKVSDICDHEIIEM